MERLDRHDRCLVAQDGLRGGVVLLLHGRVGGTGGGRYLGVVGGVAPAAVVAGAARLEQQAQVVVLVWVVRAPDLVPELGVLTAC